MAAAALAPLPTPLLPPPPRPPPPHPSTHRPSVPSSRAPTDSFNRWEAGHVLAKKLMRDLYAAAKGGEVRRPTWVRRGQAAVGRAGWRLG